VLTGRELPGLTPFPGDPLVEAFPGFDLDGRRIALAAWRRAGPRGSLKVLELGTGRELLVLPDLEDLPSEPRPALDRAGARLALATDPPGNQDGGKLAIWDVDRRQLLHTISLPAALTAVGRSLALSADGKRLAAWIATPGPYDPKVPGDIRIWDTDSGQEARRVPGGPGARGGVLAYGPDGKYLASAGARETVLRLRDAGSGEPVRELTGQEEEFWGLAFSPDGAWLASLDGESRVLLWSLAPEGGDAKRAPARTLRGIERFRSVAFSGDSRLVCAAGIDGTIKTWEMASRDERVLVRQPGGRLAGCAAAGDPPRFAGVWMLAAGKTEYKVWDAGGQVIFTTAETAKLHPRYINTGGPRLSSDGSRLVYATGNGKGTGRIRVWDLRSEKELFHHDSDRGPFFDLGFSRDGRLLASCDLPNGDGPARLSVWDLAGAKELLGMDLPGSVQLALGPDGRRLAAGINTYTGNKPACQLRVWDVATGQEAFPPVEYRGEMGRPAFRPDGLLLAVPLAETTGASAIHLLDARTGQVLGAPFRGHRGSVEQLAFSPDSQRLVSWDQWGGEVKIWAMASGREVLTLPMKGASQFAFSPDGSRLYWATGAFEGAEVQVHIWNATLLPGHGAR
jgi:WD40 repeat protein